MSGKRPLKYVWIQSEIAPTNGRLAVVVWKRRTKGPVNSGNPDYCGSFLMDEWLRLGGPDIAKGKCKRILNPFWKGAKS